MNRRRVGVLVVAWLVAGTGCLGVGGPGPVESSFDDDAEGWTVTGDAQRGNAEPAHESAGGNPGGYLAAEDDVSGGVWYWNASGAYLGDRAAYAGGELRFALAQSATDSPFDARDVVLASGSTTLTYAFDAHPGTDWTDYAVPLDADEWRDDDTGDPVSTDEFEAVLADLDRLWIRGEYRDGADTGRLDSVVLSPP